LRNTQPRAGAHNGAGVVLLHGISSAPLVLRRLEHALRRAGFATLNLDYQSRKKPLEELSEDIRPAVAAFAENNCGPIHFVGHSMGGLLARVYLVNHRPVRLGRVVMLGTPNNGSEIVDLLKHYPAYRAWFGPAGAQLATLQDATLATLPPVDYAVGIIAGCRSLLHPIASSFILPRPNDGRVSVQSCKLAGMADHTIVKASHTALPFNRLAIRQTIAFLQDGCFQKSAAA
jgi:pimeloyl-ACP methyl ester carboxylesterase